MCKKQLHTYTPAHTRVHMEGVHDVARDVRITVRGIICKNFEIFL